MSEVGVADVSSTQDEVDVKMTIEASNCKSDCEIQSENKNEGVVDLSVDQGNLAIRDEEKQGLPSRDPASELIQVPAPEVYQSENEDKVIKKIDIEDKLFQRSIKNEPVENNSSGKDDLKQPTINSSDIDEKVKVECKEEVDKKWWGTAIKEDIKEDKKFYPKRDIDMMPPPKAPPPVAIWSPARLGKLSGFDYKYNGKISSLSPFNTGDTSPGTSFPRSHFLHPYVTYFENVFSNQSNDRFQDAVKTGNSSNVDWAFCKPSTSTNRTFHKEGPSNGVQSIASTNVSLSQIPSSTFSNQDSTASGASAKYDSEDESSEDSETSFSVEKFYLQQRGPVVKKSAQPRRRDENVVSSSISDLGEYNFSQFIKICLFNRGKSVCNI